MKRLEGLAKLTGAERYIDDVPIPGCLWGMTVRSPAPRGRIREIRFGKSTDWSRFTVLDHRDIPGPNETYLIENDQPVLAGEYTRHIHEAVALIAGPDREAVRRAVADVKVIVDADEPYLDYRTPPRPEQAQRDPGNLLKHLHIEKGEVEAALASAAHIVEGTYETGAQEHVYIENQGMAAWLDGDVVVVQGSMQCPYYVLNALKHALARDQAQLRVIQSPTGGGFGGKEDYPSTIALHAALLAMKARRPVKIVYDRGEDMAATTKRHPARVRHRTGLSADGRLLAQDIDVLMDGGAYVTLSPVVLSRGIIHAAGPYFCPHVRIDGRAVLTNTVPFGAFRGFGAPQTQFACERHMDVIARRLNIDPVELRRINLLRDGQATSTGQIVKGGTDRIALMNETIRLAGLEERRREHESFNATHPYLRRGIGLAAIYHGAGFTGNGEVYLKSRQDVAGLPDGRIEVLSASTEMGQGTTTVFTQIAAAAAGYDASEIVVAIPDTSRVPNSGPTVASRTAMVVGRLIERAVDDLRAQLAVPTARGRQLRDAIIAWHRNNPGRELRAHAIYEAPSDVVWDDKTYKGDAYATFSWGCYAAEVEVDLRTFGIRLTDFVAVQEAGRILNPTLATGQVQGGVVQGIGWALMEDVKYRDGAMVNNQLTNYIIPTSDDLPQIRVAFVQNAYERGGGGAKGLGELPMDGPAPAIANAIAAATGCEPTEIPLTPERLMALVDHEPVV
jgi:CO/xanthine dehydrogenase Mo-binding subunit